MDILFEHKFLPKKSLERVNLNGKRHYVTAEGDVYPSVTTIVSEMSDKSGLETWKARVGEAEAAKILRQAHVRGTMHHTMAERYLLNNPDWKAGVPPIDLFNFMTIKPFIDSNVKTVYGIEHPLYSHRLKAAGTTDLIADWNGKLSIIDFKTSRKPKKREHVENYFIQGGFYGLMVRELYNLDVRQIVILMMVDYEEPMCYVESLDDYSAKVEATSKGYYDAQESRYNTGA